MHGVRQMNLLHSIRRRKSISPESTVAMGRSTTCYRMSTTKFKRSSGFHIVVNKHSSCCQTIGKSGKNTKNAAYALGSIDVDSTCSVH